MVDTVKCQTEADLTEPFYKKLLLGAIDKTLDHEESIAAPRAYKNYTHHHSQPTLGAAASVDLQQQDDENSTGKIWDIDQRPAESLHAVGQKSRSVPRTSTLNHPYNNILDTANQPSSRFFAESSLDQASEQQQHFREGPPSLPDRRLIRPLTMPPDASILANLPGNEPRHRVSLGFLNKRWRAP